MMRQMGESGSCQAHVGTNENVDPGFSSSPAGTTRCAEVERVQGSTTIDIDQISK